MEIVRADEFATALVDLAEDINLVFCILFFDKVGGWAYVTISSWFDHLPEVEPAGDPLKTVYYNLSALKYFL